jgi:S1-C subfamily serine protease
MCNETLAGVEVAKVFPGSFGADAGLEPGDILLDIAGAAIFTMAEVWALVREHKPGDRLVIRYVRGRHLRSGQAALSNANDFPQ